MNITENYENDYWSWHDRKKSIKRWLMIDDGNTRLAKLKKTFSGCVTYHCILFHV